MALGKAVVNIMANLGPLKRGLANAAIATKKMVGSISKGAFRVLSSGIRSVIRLAKTATIALLGIGAASVKIAMDAEETENLFVESMGNMTDASRRWVQEYSKSMGLYETDTKKMLSTLNVMLNSMGLSEEEAYKMSRGLTTLSNDMASFYNLKPEEAFLKLQAGITGESEPLKRLGIMIKDTSLKMYQMKDATLKDKKELSELEKVQLRYVAILDQTKKSQGDMKRTLDSTTNVFRTIKAQVQSAAENIGNVFMPMVTDMAQSVRDWLIDNQDTITDWAEEIKYRIEIVATVIRGLIDLAKEGRWDSILQIAMNAVKQVYQWVSSELVKLKPIAMSIGEQIGIGIRAGLTGISDKKKDVAVGGGLIAGGAAVGGLLGGPVGAGIGAGVGAIGAAGRVDARHISDLVELMKDLIRVNKRIEKQNEIIEGF
ncbi:MAG: hypothetical protein DRP56_06935 [Planctomycetota bacterium]|nr:MAG: hypothetical protein DRP56_06935 [Planctomycetota bacterium]